MGKMSKSFLVVIAIMICCSGSMAIRGQGVCVIAEKKLSTIAGTVRFLNTENFAEGAKLELKDRKGKFISKMATDEDGWFEFSDIDKGKYTLIVSYPDFATLYIPVKVRKRNKKSKLRISLGPLIGVPCGGGDVTTVDEN